MFNKTLSSLAVAASLIAAPALALADVGFEGGSAAGYTTSGNGSSSVETSLNYVFTTADYGFDAAGTVGPAVGSNFGAFTALGGPNDPYTVTYTFATPTAAVDVLYLGIITADAIAGNYDDSVNIKLNSATGTYFDSTFTASQLDAIKGYYPFSDWIPVQVAAGTTSFTLTLNNAIDNANPPTLVVDYYKTPTPAVPEADAVVMALAGLGVAAGLVRRRKAA